MSFTSPGEGDGVGGERRAHRLPVLNLTALVDDAGELTFARDIYYRDAGLEEAMRRPLSRC
jgi:hypothetical protein